MIVYYSYLNWLLNYKKVSILTKIETIFVLLSKIFFHYAKIIGSIPLIIRLVLRLWQQQSQNGEYQCSNRQHIGIEICREYKNGTYPRRH